MSGFKVGLFGNKSFTQLFRYALIGIVLNTLGFVLYYFLTSTGFKPKITMTVLYGVGVIIGFYVHKFTFSYGGSVFEAVVRYGITHLFGYLLNLLILVIFVDVYEFSHTIVQGVAIFIVTVFTFLSSKFIVFRSMLHGKSALWPSIHHAKWYKKSKGVTVVKPPK